MGVVFSARQLSLNRVVALKTLHPFASITDDVAVRRFRLEAEAIAHLEHPNIVPIYEVGEYEGHHYFTMRLIEGGSLAQRIASFSDCEKASAQLMATIARAVPYAHQRGILHRDLKPANILIDAKDQPHITDFGLAKILGRTSDLTATGVPMGTPNYMSPEQVRGRHRELTSATDTFSLGASLYHLLTGRPPFESKFALETIRRVDDAAPQRPCVRNPWLDPDLQTICLKWLENEPKGCYVSAEALADDLERWLNDKPIMSRPTAVVKRLAKSIRLREAEIFSEFVTDGYWGGLSRMSGRSLDEFFSYLKEVKSCEELANFPCEDTARQKVFADYIRQSLKEREFILKINRIRKQLGLGDLTGLKRDERPKVRTDEKSSLQTEL